MPLLLAYLKVLHQNLLQVKFQLIFWLFSVAEVTGLSLALSETLIASMPICVNAHIKKYYNWLVGTPQPY